jgi:hypothetical protein
MKVKNRHDIHITPGDVEIRPLESIECSQCGKRATHGVWLDLRGIGFSVITDKFCDACAKELAVQLRKSI